MKKWIALAFVSVLFGCLQGQQGVAGPQGPQGDSGQDGGQSFSVTGKFDRVAITSMDSAFIDTAQYYTNDTVTLNAQVKNIRDGRYPSEAIISCEKTVFLIRTSVGDPFQNLLVKVPADSLFLDAVRVQDTLMTDGLHVQNVFITSERLFSPPDSSCSYTLIFN
jgi:hypothetical protein